MEEINEQDEGSKNIKDMRDDLNNRLAMIMNQIDAIKMELAINPSLLLNYNERVHSLFLNLSRKLTQTEIKEQWKMNEELSKINPFVTRNMDEDGECEAHTAMHTKNFPVYKNKLEEREMNLYDLIEKLETKRRVV